MTDAVEQQAAFSRECALIAAKAADEKKATDIMVQEVRDLIGVTDYFVIATAANSRQVDAIIDEIEDKLREEASIKPTHREMSADGSWSLLDYGNIRCEVPSAMAANSTARCEIDLSPGTETSPASGPPSGSMIV